MNFIIEPPKKIPVIDETDICVLGGSATGVFAAVRAARLGARVTLIEKQNSFGGAASSGLVHIWHSLYDTEGKKQIISGLTEEVINRLRKRDALSQGHNANTAYRLNTEELKIELDELIRESKVTPLLHTLFTAPYLENDRLSGVIIENKSGRQAVKARFFIDATGDGDLCAALGLPFSISDTPQPPTTCAKIFGTADLRDFNLQEALHLHHSEFDLEDDWGWSAPVPGVPNVKMHAETHVFNVNCAEASDLTRSEIEGRRQVRGMMDIIRKYAPEGKKISLLSLPSYIGVRETRRFSCLYRLTENDVLTGKRFDDAIANGSYRVDIHHNEKPGITFRYLDGTEEYCRRGSPTQYSRWRPETKTNPTFYQIPYRSLIPGAYNNLIACGRMIDADKGAYGAIRVMVNMNQTGEAAGTAAYLALTTGCGISDVNIDSLRSSLKRGGSIVF